MLAPAITKVREFLGSWKNLLALGTLPILGAWIYSRVWMVNPAILGDEYLYSMNARKVGPWDPPVAGDFSNYLFNFVYQGTNLCGDAFYACGKIFNIVFFLGFILTIFILALRFLPFWGAYALMIASGLSPLSVYTSMFLPESMYFFFIGLVLVAVLRAMRVFTWQNWALAGAAIGVASLVKPHAWLSAIAVGITMLVVGLFNKDIGFKKTFVAGLGLVAGAALARVILGLLVAGPKALGFFGQYLGLSTIQTAVSAPAFPVSDEGGLTSPIDGVLTLFPAQFNIHLLTFIALMAIGLVGVVVGLANLIQTKTLDPVNGFSLFAFIWLGSLMIEIVMFTGWVTGTGDDHTTRVLLRYYEFLMLIIPTAALASFHARFASSMGWPFRWLIATPLLLLISPAFSGFFGTLAIQIADAPFLAGLVVNEQVFNSAAIIGFLSLVLFATYPKFSAYGVYAVLLVVFIGGGFQTQGQYQLFRGTDSPADIAGKYLAQAYAGDDFLDLKVLAASRFDATNVGIWMDSPDLDYDILVPGYPINVQEIPEEKSLFLFIGPYDLVGEYRILNQGEGFSLIEVSG